MFPVLAGDDRRSYELADAPKSVPWSLLAPHESQALANHSQTLERLAERGGLGVDEMVCVLDHRPGRDVHGMRLDVALKRLRELLAAHAARPTDPAVHTREDDRG
jgi:hypothetical protein